MARALLGQPIDIHTGGMDHIPVHHTNEIAQSEAAFGKPLARYWMHQAFLTMDGEKISKSLGNDVYLSDVTERGYSPLALRYLFLQAHYRTPLSFTWESLAAADEALKRLRRLAYAAYEEAKGVATPSDDSRRMVALLRDDLATPAALAFLWEVLKDEFRSPGAIWAVVEAADQVFGLELASGPLSPKPLAKEDLPEEIRALVSSRELARQTRDFARSDELRIHIENRGYRVEDAPSGTIVTRRPG
jgi:cysteinyl-tRNA synthetase